MTEPDLEDGDLDAQIERCEVRIRENIMPHIFHHRLSQLKMEQAERSALAGSEPGRHSWDVVRRLHMLRSLEVELQSEDRFDQLANVRALLQAYRQYRLNWYPGLVTYWSRGVQLCEPRPFSWDEFEVLNAHHAGATGFWMEGLVGPGPRRGLSAFNLPDLPEAELGHFIRHYYVAVRLPGNSWWGEVKFLYDTGADSMTIYEGDLAILRGRSSIVPSIMGQQELVFANQSASFLPVIELEVSLLDPGTRQRVTTWARVQCNVFKGYANSESSRLDGPWLRYMLYTATAPRNDNRMIVGNVYSDVINLLPNTDRLLPRPPAYMGLHSPGRRISLRPSGTAPIGDLAEDPKPVMTEGDIPGPGVAHKTAKAAPTAPKVVI